MTKASDNAFPSILITEGTEPSAPDAGKQRLYIDSSTHKLKRTDSGGTDVTIEGTGDITTDTAWAAKGDLIVGTANNTAAILTAGTNDYVLTADDGEATGLKWAASIGASLALPTVVQPGKSKYEGSSATCAVTLDGAPTVGKKMYCIIGSNARGCDSITQTNVAWTKLYGMNGNSQFFEVWGGVISASAGTLVTANFTGNGKEQIAVIELSVALTTAGTAVTNTSAGATLYNIGPLTTSAGDYVFGGISANAAASSQLWVGMPCMPTCDSATNGAVNARLIRSVGGSVSAWGTIASSLAYAGALVIMS